MARECQKRVRQGQLLATITGVDGRHATYCIRFHHQLLGVEGVLDEGIAVSASLCVRASPCPRWYSYRYRRAKNM